MSVIFPGLEEYHESSFSFRGTGGYGTGDFDEELIDKFDITDAVYVMIDVAHFNRKLGLTKDGSKIIDSTFNPDNDRFPVDKIIITVEEFASDVKPEHVISVGKFETLYSDFSRYVRTYFNHAGITTLFDSVSDYRINNDVFDKNVLVDTLTGRLNNTDAGVYMTSISGSISLSNVNNLLHMASYTNAFRNRDNYLNSDGFISGDLIFIPNGIQFKLNVDVGMRSNALLQQFKNVIPTDRILDMSPSCITKTMSAPLVLRLSNFPEETAGNYVLPNTDINTGDYKWINRGFSYGCRKWTSIAMSSTGMNQLVGEYEGYLYRSGDYGTTWSQCTVDAQMWSCISVSDTGQYQSACSYDSYIYVSSDYGNMWTNVATRQKWSSISISSTGKYQSATVMDGSIWYSHDCGVTWNPCFANHRWKSIAISFTGQHQTAVAYGDCIYRSPDYGLNWKRAYAAKCDWTSVAISASSQYQIACANNGHVVISDDFGETWTQTSLEPNRWTCVAMCGAGQHQSAVAQHGDIFTSKDYGIHWTNSTRKTASITHLEHFGIQSDEVHKFDYSASVQTESSKMYIGAKSKSWSSVAISFGGNIQSSIAWDGSIYLSKMF